MNVAILCGGLSAEHQVSLFSAKNILTALDRNIYNPIVIGITTEGKWLHFSENEFLNNEDDISKISLRSDLGNEIFISPGQPGKWFVDDTELRIDVVFPVLHGPFGEDGKTQGLLESMGVPYVGADVLGSAVGMDKDVMKRLLREAGLPVGHFMTIHKDNAVDTNKILDELGLPVFVKPANMGSSVGISKVFDLKDLQFALNEAFKYDQKVLIESYIEGREIECAIIGNTEIEASCLGEVIPVLDYYSYEAKYLDGNGSILNIPAKLDDEVAQEMRSIAIKVFKVLGCKGFGRVDMFLTSDNQIYINEINTIPGFTNISMYPKLWEEGGLVYKNLISKLIQTALE